MKLNIQLFAGSISTTITETNLDVNNNTSTLKIKVTFTANNNVTYFSNKTLYCTCDGVTQSAKVSLSAGGTGWKTFTFNNIDHGPSGTRDVKWNWKCETGTSVLGTMKDSGTQSLAPLHTPPTINSITMQEVNPTLVRAGISNDYFVLGLSQKQFTINATYEDSATYDHTTIANVYTLGQLYDNPKFKNIDVLTSTNNILDTKTIEILPYYTNVFTSNVRFYYIVYDNLGGKTEYFNNQYYFFEYNYQTYTPITLTASVKRVGQTSGNVKITASGTYYNGTIGNENHSGTYKPTLIYKYWEAGQDETQATIVTIPSSSITTSNGTYSCEYQISGFSYEKAYRFKVAVQDTLNNNSSMWFSSASTNELSIATGKALWTEFKDRVDFAKLTINHKEILVPYTLFESSSGSTSNITLQNDSFANYEYLEVYYLYEASDTNYGEYYAKVSNPDGNKIPLTIIVDSGNLYTLYCVYSISGTTMTRGTPSQWRFTTSNGNHTRSTPTGCFAITKVVGYK